MDRSWVNSRPFSKAHLDGVTEFMNFVSDKLGDNQEILCPCRKCLNRIHRHKGDVEDHLLIHGMTNTYTRWIHHGEALEVRLNENSETRDIGCSIETGDGGCHFETEMNEPEDDPDDDRIHDIVQELYTAEDRGPQTKSKFATLLEEMKQELHPDCPYSRFSFVVKLLHIKSFYRFSNVGFSAFLKFLSLAFPKCPIPASYAEAKKVIRALGLGYDSIHVCPNNCVLFRKELAKKDNCPVCGASRWNDEDTRKKIPNKVLRHFPVVPRLQRMFTSKKISEQAQWHKLKRKPVDNELKHPADGEAWKDFDRKYGWFAKDARNVRLGLATDGFNPFGKMSTNYSMWPVVLIPYNFPPWECMEQSNFMMGLLIPGPTCPGKDMDLFLQPLIEELLDLWKGVPTYDALTRKSFDLHAAVIWCIHDYPALSTLSGRIARGYYACVRCDKNPCSRKLRNKICYIDNRRFLPSDHVWRTKKFFNGHTEEREQPEEFTMDELNEQLARVSHVKPGNHPDNKKRKRLEEGQCWKRRSSLWDLPYWSNLKLRHNLDVMHIEKNICEAILRTLMDVAGKSKDTISARLDLEDMGIRKNLHLKHDGDSYTLPRAPYTMTKDQKLAFCAFIKNVKFPDGYASNLSRCISADECKVQGLKTHDCHILLQRILPAGLRGIMDKEIYEPIAELGSFFQQICAKTLKVDVLNKMKGEIPKILCKLEKIFPPSFFDVMVHLTLHLVDDAILRGPVQYGWMYPVERRLLTLKRYVRNMRRPEGSIAEAYVADECLNACSRYFDDIDTRHNREGRNRERVVLKEGGLPIFQHGVSLLGASRMTFLEKDYDKMVWYVLNNTPEVEPFIEICRTELQSAGNVDVDRALAKEFPGWFKKHLATKKFVHGEEVNDDLYALIKFDINTDSSPVKAACEDILKGGVRQMRYRLKKKYFDGVPANQVRTTSPLKHMSDEEWRQLVDMWSSPEHKDKCAKNQLNREKVKYQQRTGSRSYIAQAYIVKQEKYKDSEPTAIDLFEEFHCSKTKGFSEPVKKAIDDMHAQEALTSPSVEDGQQAKTSIEAISKVLPKSNTFLRNVGIQQPAAKTTNVVKDLQTELDVKKLESARLQQELESRPGYRASSARYSSARYSSAC